jgi:hypothetical protein
VRAEIRIVLPPGITPDPARLHVDADESYDAASSPDYHDTKTMTERVVRVVENGFEVPLVHRVGPGEYVFVRAWYDANETASSARATSSA